MLNIWRLKLLAQFQTLGTMQRVSEVMHTSIATVSQQLNLLEQETNIILFEKVLSAQNPQIFFESYNFV